VYPPEHDGLAAECAAAGAVVSEAPLRAEPQKGMFHARNRIISGLARAVVVIEASARSGALITARHAAEQGRDVLVVPGGVDGAAAEGWLELIRQGAKLVRNADDVLAELGGLARRPAPPNAAPSLFGERAVGHTNAPVSEFLAVLDGVQRSVYEALTERKHGD